MRALLSVSDKTGLVDFARGLHERGVALISTGGTYAALVSAGLPATEVANITGFPEMLDGRVKTLHPKIHGGLLGRNTPEHRAAMEAHGIEAIDLLVVNLYPFAQTIARPNASFADAIENIDIGGPAMVRSAAKNHERVAVVTSPSDYGRVLVELRAGAISSTTRLALAQKAFAHTAAYDGAIANFLGSLSADASSAPDAAPVRAAYPSTMSLQWRRHSELRYGENPHQSAAFYVDDVSRAHPTIAAAEVLGGKALSYNNLLDLDAALSCVLEFSPPTAVVVKHNNPCGVASAADIATAYERARAADPVSAFGGIIAVNRMVTRPLAALLAETFLECVIAPGYDDDARALLQEKKNLRLLAAGGQWQAAPATRSLRTISGGVLVQDTDADIADWSRAQVATTRAPTDVERDDLLFASKVCKHVKSNAIVFAKGGVTLAIGAGQMSRVESVHICQRKAGAALAGSAVASDAFFPFRDGVDVLAAAGATSVIQPGGSVRDAEVIVAANEHKLAMVLTGVRHFRH